ncbi:MAG: diacylglycerol kinase [Desulfobulbus propionicus]|nr:MAG: diacylglycerol kinase [Desulfobulbus propionicus]
MAQKPNGSGLQRLWRASLCSWSGLVKAWRNESAFRQEVALVIFGLPCALWLGNSGVERALLVGSLLQILLVELLNSSIEAVVDRIGPERHVLSGQAKDLGSAAVSLTLFIAAVIWLLIVLN